MADYPSSKWAGHGGLTDLVDYWNAARANAISDEVVAVETELGTDPAGDFDDVAARLAAIDAQLMTFYDPDAGSCVYVPRFALSAVDYGGFVIQQFPASQPNATADDDNPDVADGAAVGATKAHSKMGVSPWREITSLEARKACANIGTGWHLISAFEWASIAYLSQALGTMPHGPNADTDPPSDVTFPSEKGLRDRALAARGAHDSALTGSGPVEWSHNHRGGIYGLNGVLWQWNDGLFLLPENQNDNSDTPHAITGAGEAGYCLILANREVSLTLAPYGSSTATAAGSLTDTNKSYVVNAFTGHYLYDSAGSLFYIDSNTATALSIDGADTPATGPYTVVKLEATDITSGMTTGNRILTFSADADLAPLAIPATTDATGSATCGNDGYWHAATALRAAFRGGSWDNGVRAGVFALLLIYAPSGRAVGGGFRACKSL